MKVIVQQAVAVKQERLALFEVAHGLQKGLEVGRLMEHVLTVVAAVEDVIDQFVGHRPERARHADRLGNQHDAVKEIVLTLFQVLFQVLRSSVIASRKT